MDKVIRFQDIKSLFPEDEWDIGYMTKEQLKICAYNPIKKSAQGWGENFINDIYFNGNFTNCIVITKLLYSTMNYWFYKDVMKILKDGGLQNNCFFIYTNYKEAALQAGLGIRAKNSLIYNYRFGFNSKICVIGFNDLIVNTPINKHVNRELLDLCVGCWDCSINCPVKAIHNKGNKMENNWLDSSKCDGFIGTGNDTIPGKLKFIHERMYPKIPIEIMSFNLVNSLECINGYEFVIPFGYMKDKKPISMPICYECGTQLKCKKGIKNGS
jgi:ferredoxin